MPGRINEGWLNYLRLVVPGKASQIQVDETRTAFYAGVATMFSILESLAHGDPNNDDPEVAILEGIKKELIDYTNSLKKGLKA